MPLNAKEAKQLNEQKACVKLAWEHACKHDGIDAASKFVVFSNDNPFAKTHNEQMAEYLKLMARIKKNIARRDRHAAFTSCGLKRVKGALGGVYYE